MKIFVAFGYNERDQWIRDLVFPMIKAFGDEVVSGEDIQGQQIPDAVRRNITQSNALMAFVTRRKKNNNGRTWSTHRWVTDELAIATANNLPVVEIREKGVDEQGGIVTDRQRIMYDERERDKCLVEIVKTLGNWHTTDTIELKLLPNECMQAVRPHLRDPNLQCTYQILENGRLGELISAQILPITGGLFVRANQVPAKSFIQIRIQCAGKWWSSEFENVESVGIHLHEE